MLEEPRKDGIVKASNLRVVINKIGDPEWGSTRIWRDNLATTLNALDIDVEVNDFESYQNYDVAIFGKGSAPDQLAMARSTNPEILIGVVQPNDITVKGKANLRLADFYIVGSIEERDYFRRHNPKTFIYPLIEQIVGRWKLHEDKKTTVIGYHGNRVHLEENSAALVEALTKLGKERDIEFRAIYNIEAVGRWKTAPSVPMKHVQWTLDTIWDELLECDIGVVPGVRSIRRIALFPQQVVDWLNRALELRSKVRSPEWEYRQIFKINSNAGRSYVFHQLGIPVVADFVPSNFHILGNPENGYLAHSVEGWYSALAELAASAEYRKKIARNAYAEFCRHYDPKIWASRLIEDLKELKT